MCKLKIFQACGVTAFLDGDNVVKCRRPRVRKYFLKVNGSPAYSANRLTVEDYLLRLFILCFRPSMIGTFRFRHCHSPNKKDPCTIGKQGSLSLKGQEIQNECVMKCNFVLFLIAYYYKRKSNSVQFSTDFQRFEFVVWNEGFLRNERRNCVQTFSAVIIG